MFGTFGCNRQAWDKHTTHLAVQHGNRAPPWQRNTPQQVVP